MKRKKWFSRRIPRVRPFFFKDTLRITFLAYFPISRYVNSSFSFKVVPREQIIGKDSLKVRYSTDVQVSAHLSKY